MKATGIVRRVDDLGRIVIIGAVGDFQLCNTGSVKKKPLGWYILTKNET